MTFPDVRGDYRLSWDEIRQLNQLVAQRSDIKKPLMSVVMEAADRAEVSSGNVPWGVGKISVFTIRKKEGRWIIEESSVREVEVIVTA